MDHLVTYPVLGDHHAAVVGEPARQRSGGLRPALVIDEINSRMWTPSTLGHLAIKERVDNLIRWGFFVRTNNRRRTRPSR